MDGENRDPTLEHDELGELDGEVVRPVQHDFPQIKVCPLTLFVLSFQVTSALL